MAEGKALEEVDVVVIGAGVIGCTVARELARYKASVLVLERAHDVGEGSSKANSGIIHAGFHARAGSLKGRACAEGSALYSDLAEELGVSFKRCGAMMVAFSDVGIATLEEKAERARANGAWGIEIVSGDAARALEPRLSSDVIAAMLAPSTGIISPFELVLALAENAVANGVRFRFDAEVVECSTQQARYLLRCRDGSSVAARFVVNAAGDGAMPLDAQVHPADYVIKPRLGQYLVFDKQPSEGAITHVIYQAGENDEGGTLLAPTVEGNLLAGPTSHNTRYFNATASTQEGLEHVWRVASKLIPSLKLADVITNFAGVRTNIANVAKEKKDFVVRASAPGFISAIGIKNPGMTCAPALAKRIVGLLADDGLELAPNPAFNPVRTPYVPMLRRSSAEQQSLLRSDASYGRVICRCEGITEGDVRAVLGRPLPPRTLDGVKDRLRTGMGRCQGAFCTARVASIMAEAMGVEESEIQRGQRGGRLVARRVK